jgi:putative spermidine/putrescine transport system substrate-binding protein
MPGSAFRATAAVVIVTAIVTVIAACGGGTEGVKSTPAAIPKMPKSAVTLNIIDVAGNLQLTQKAIDQYRKTHPDAVRRVTYTKATAPELAGKVKAQQQARRLDIDLVLTGTDGLSAGIAQNLWLKLLPNLGAKFPGLQDNYLPPAAKMQQQAQGFGVVVTYYPSGPLLEYAPGRVQDPPKTPQELLAWAKAHPGKFMYAQPSNSGPGRTFLMGLPYLLGDSNPRDPIHGWNKTWAFLKELDKYVAYYPAGTKDTMSGLADGSRDMIATTTGWDINPRALGTVPKDVQVAPLDGFHWVTDAHYMVVPKGIAQDKLAVVLDLMSYLLKPQQQALAYDDGYFYPGPAVKDVGVEMAPAKSQQVVKEYGRQEYPALIDSRPKETPLIGATLVAAFDKWDRDVGGSKVKEG